MALRISPTWLKSFCHLKASTEEIADLLSQTGFETEVINDLEIDPMLVVGKIESIEPHPNADKLNICQVNIGSTVLQIVCGCPTVVHANTVIVAPVGAKLPGMTLKPVTLRGVESQGMICSLKEIGLSDDAAGIYHFGENVEPGRLLVDHLEHDSKILEIDVTPNRGDSLSVYGIARDLAASQNVALLPFPQGDELSQYQETDTLFKVDSRNTVAYDALTGTFNSSAKTPLIMVNRLRQAGMGTNHVVVDILNYVMLEVGQPMHAFNAQALTLPLVLEEGAKKSFKLLDDSIYEAKSWDTIISDETGPHALAGIMGGFDSRMQPDTTQLQLESAIFSPQGIAKSLRNNTLGSDASYRYERGVCPNLNSIALAYTVRLLKEYTDAQFSLYQTHHTHPKQAKITLTAEWVNTYLGTQLTQKDIEQYLQRLGMDVKISEANISVTPPSYRYDIQVAEDLVEEIARLFGYNQIPLEPMSSILAPKSLSTSIASQAKICAVHNGYHEVVQFSFVSQQMLDLFPNNATPIEIRNPIHSEFGFMRTNVLQSLVMAAQYNCQRQINDLKLFEVGESFQLIDGKVQEQTELAAICIGNANKGLHNSNTSVDYYDMQRVAINVLAHLGISQVSIAKSHHPALHPKQSSCIIHSNNVVGEIGMLHPTTQNTLGLPSAGVILIYLDKLVAQDSKIISPPSKYPSITRDITLTVLDTLQIDEIESAITQAEVAYLAKFIVSDIYQQEGDSSSKSITWSFTFKSDEKTLTDKEINASVSQIRKAMRPFEIGSTDQ